MASISQEVMDIHEVALRGFKRSHGRYKQMGHITSQTTLHDITLERLHVATGRLKGIEDVLLVLGMTKKDFLLRSKKIGLDRPDLSLRRPK